MKQEDGRELTRQYTPISEQDKTGSFDVLIKVRPASVPSLCPRDVGVVVVVMWVWLWIVHVELAFSGISPKTVVYSKKPLSELAIFKISPKLAKNRGL